MKKIIRMFVAMLLLSSLVVSSAAAASNQLEFGENLGNKTTQVYKKGQIEFGKGMMVFLGLLPFIGLGLGVAVWKYAKKRSEQMQDSPWLSYVLLFVGVVAGFFLGLAVNEIITSTMTGYDGCGQEAFYKFGRGTFGMVVDDAWQCAQ